MYIPKTQDCNYPPFFDSIETIKLKDELSAFLGTSKDGIVEFSYLDIVKTAGHSCPTVAGAYIMTLVALKELYKDEVPKRGEISISFKEDSKEGVTGVIANVMTQITGATESLGFKGLNGKFKRNGLIDFNDSISSSVKFRRIDNNKDIELIYNPSSIQGSQEIPVLMEKMIKGIATKEEKENFGIVWQQRVEKIFNNIENVIKIVKVG